jgi:integrase
LKQRSKGSWRYVISDGYDPVTGKRRQITGTIRGSKRQAEQEFTRIQRDLDEGMLADAGRLTLGTYVENRYLPHIATRVRRTTLKRYRTLFRLHVIPVIGPVRLGKLRPSHVQQVIDRALEKGLNPRTVLHVHRALHAALAQALRWQLIRTNPSQAVRPPRPARPTYFIPSGEGVAQILAEAEGGPWYVPISLAATTGMRRGEVLALGWESIDLKAGLVRVVRAAEPSGRTVEMVYPKTDRGRRTVALTKPTIALLRRHRRQQAERRLVAGSDWQGDLDLVVDRGNGGVIHPDLFSQAFQRLSRRLGLKVRLHDLRHAYACMLLEQGVHPKVVSEALGHSSVAFTLDTYAHVIPSMQTDSARALERALGSASRRLGKRP